MLNINRDKYAPEVSVGLATYNGEKYISQAIESILNQDFENFELIISDNGSNDGTYSICRSYEEKDSRIRYYRYPVNQGADKNFIRAFQAARGEYFM
jgi:glycosyltransferase involved in cell wall biosynthesis